MKPLIFEKDGKRLATLTPQEGKLDEVFSALADYYEKDSSQKRKIKSALSYPIMLGVMAIGIVILMLVFVLFTEIIISN